MEIVRYYQDVKTNSILGFDDNGKAKIVKLFGIPVDIETDTSDIEEDISDLQEAIYGSDGQGGLIREVQAIETLLNMDQETVTSAIDTFTEILAFLEGVVNTSDLASLLAGKVNTGDVMAYVVRNTNLVSATLDNIANMDSSSYNRILSQQGLKDLATDLLTRFTTINNSLVGVVKSPTIETLVVKTEEEYESYNPSSNSITFVV